MLTHVDFEQSMLVGISERKHPIPGATVILSDRTKRDTVGTCIAPTKDAGGSSKLSQESTRYNRRASHAAS